MIFYESNITRCENFQLTFKIIRVITIVSNLGRRWLPLFRSLITHNLTKCQKILIAANNTTTLLYTVATVIAGFAFNEHDI